MSETENLLFLAVFVYAEVRRNKTGEEGVRLFEQNADINGYFRGGEFRDASDRRLRLGLERDGGIAEGGEAENGDQDEGGLQQAGGHGSLMEKHTMSERLAVNDWRVRDRRGVALGGSKEAMRTPN